MTGEPHTLFDEIDRFGIDSHEEMLEAYAAQARAEEAVRLEEEKRRREELEAARAAELEAKERAKQQAAARKRALAALPKVAQAKQGKPISVNDYLEYRKTQDPSLPTITTLYRLFGSWQNTLEAAGIKQSGRGEEEPYQHEDLLDAMRECARDLGAEMISTHQYDEWRQQKRAEWERNGKQAHPSSSVIRKWVGRWDEAVLKAFPVSE